MPRLRELPWRATRDAWCVLVSEVMLQQTQAQRVVPMYERFVESWPDPATCAAAPLGDLLSAWQGLGYPRRCRNLHEAAKMVVERHGGEVPATLEELSALPGVGDYTARAVLAFAHCRDVGPVDTNVSRVLSRWAGEPLGRAAVQARADGAVPAGRSWEWNQSMMDLGATVCTARAPRCGECPMRAHCVWHGSLGDDPAPRSAGASRAQARFEGSDRQARGRLMRALVGSQVQESDVAAAMGLGDDKQRAAVLLGSLRSDGLVVVVDGWCRLP